LKPTECLINRALFWLKKYLTEASKVKIKEASQFKVDVVAI